jgi:hypothetical protein
MAHFQVPLKLPNVKEFTRFWVTGTSGDEQIVLHLTDIHRMTALLRLRLLLSTDFGNAKP